MPTKKMPMRDLIVLLPGIMGSVLQKDNKDLFALSWGAAWGALTSAGKSLQLMKLAQDDPNGGDLDDGITAPRLMNDAHLIPGFFKIDGYTHVSQFIRNSFDVVPGDVFDSTKPANYFEFPYDWRRDNRVAALRLKTLIDTRLPQWKERSGYDQAKVVLVGHSMGGLVSRYYLEKLDGWRDARALITFGTPYRGSVNALSFLANGYKKRFIDLTEVLRSFTSSYQLLPIYKVVKVGNEFRRIEELNIPGVDSARAAQARTEFHGAIQEAVESHQNDADYLKSYKIVPIVGTRQPTLQSAAFEGGTLTPNEIVPSENEEDQLLAEGDGTVPRLSATPIELSEEYRETYFAEHHASLQNNDSVLADLSNRLRQMQTNLSQFRGAAPSLAASQRPAISLKLDDMYFADEPVTMRVQLINVSDQLREVSPTARIMRADNSQPSIERKFVPDGDAWTLISDPLPIGNYRVEVLSDEFAADAPPPVHDIFEVQQ